LYPGVHKINQKDEIISINFGQFWKRNSKSDNFSGGNSHWVNGY